MKVKSWLCLFIVLLLLQPSCFCAGDTVVMTREDFQELDRVMSQLKIANQQQSLIIENLQDRNEKLESLSESKQKILEQQEILIEQQKSLYKKEKKSYGKHL